jgi:hypothetical protein
MSQLRKLTIGALNITAHPHPSPQIYVDIFKTAYGLKYQFPIWGEIHGILGSVLTIDPKKADSWVSGEIFRFLKINIDDPWFDLSKFDEADEEECKKIHIPDNLRPNFIRINYKFIPKHHLIFFEIYRDEARLTTSMAKKFFSTLLNHEKMQDKYGPIDVTVIPKKEIVEQILRNKSLNDIMLVISRPNTDGLAHEERVFLEQLNSQNSREQTLSHKAQKGKYLKPNDQLKVLARIAARNGFVKAHYTDEEGVSIPVSTIDHPETKTVYYDPEKENHGDLFNQTVTEMLTTMETAGK